MQHEVKPKAKDAKHPPRNLIYKQNELYEIDDAGYRLSRESQRQAAQLNAQADFELAAEEELNAPLPPEIADQIMDQHQTNVARVRSQKVKPLPEDLMPKRKQ
jgi:hypothetical protein